MDSINNRVKNILNNTTGNVNQPFPKKNLLIEVTNQCNNACVFCANRKMTRRKGMIDSKIVRKVLEECFELGTREVGFYATGEPLLNINLESYLKLAKDIGYTYIYLTTNGLKANVERVTKIFEAGLDSLKFSINAIDSEKYKFIHGVDCFDIIIRNLKDALELKNTLYSDKKLSVSYIKTKFNDATEIEIKEFFKDMCDEVVISKARNQGGLISEIDLLVDDADKNMKLPCFYVFNSINVSITV